MRSLLFVLLLILAQTGSWGAGSLWSEEPKGIYLPPMAEEEYSECVSSAVTSIFVAQDGYIYATGYSHPCTGGDSDIFVAMVSPGVERVEKIVYVGGNGYEMGNLIYVTDDAVYIAGISSSKNFPFTYNWGVTCEVGIDDIVVLKYDRNLNKLLSSACVNFDSEGNKVQFVTSMTVDKGGVYISAYISPVTSDIQVDYSYLPIGNTSSVVFKLTLTLDKLLASFYLDNEGTDVINSIFLFHDKLYVGGWTNSSNFPFKSSSLPQFWGNAHGFVGVLSSDLGNPLFTLIEKGTDVMVNSIFVKGDFIYAAGWYRVRSYLTANPMVLMPENSGIFVAKFSKELTQPVEIYGTRKKIYPYEFPPDIATNVFVDDRDYVYVAGYTYSENFPVSNNGYDNTFNGGIDIFIDMFEKDLKEPTVSTFLGGKRDDLPTSLFVDWMGNVYVGGYTTSEDFPIGNTGETEGKFQRGFVFYFPADYFGGPYFNYGRVEGEANDQTQGCGCSVENGSWQWGDMAVWLGVMLLWWGVRIINIRSKL